MSIDLSTATGCRYNFAAQYYDLNYGERAPNDVPFYLELAQRCGGDVLELGAGTGRVALELARAGYNVTALDYSPAMLELFAAKLADESAEVRGRITLVEGDMAQFDLVRRFSLITMPFSAFQHVLTTEGQRSCFEAVRRHLAEDGVFVYNGFNPNVQYIANWVQQGPVWKMDMNCTDPATGNMVRRYFYPDPDPARQLHNLWFRWEEFDAEGVLLTTKVEHLPMRWQYRWEAEYLLELCGLKVVERYSDYEYAPLEAKVSRLIYVCRPL
jgi:SAM-dependent methyltransferase